MVDEPPAGEEPPAYALPPAPVIEPTVRPPGRGRRAALVAILLAAAGVVAVVAILFGTGRLGQPARPLPRVALIDPAGGLAIVDAQGGNRIVHAPTGTTFTFPAWSPDGSRVAAVAATAEGAAIEVFAAGSSGATEGTVLYQSGAQAPFYLYWTPDGRAITFLTNEGEGSLALRSAPADASAESTILREGAPMYWAWEGQDRMLVHTGSDTEAFLGAVATDGTTVTTLAGPPGDFRAPAASGDGRYEAYAVSKPDGAAAVVVAASDGSASHEFPVFGSSAFSFAPAGPQLAYIGPGEGDRQAPLPFGPLRIVDASTGEARELPAKDLVAFFWSPDGSRIATIGLATPSDPSSADRPAPAAGGPQLASVTRDGSDLGERGPRDAPGVDVAVTFVDVAAGTATAPQVVSLSPLFVNQVLPYFDQYALSHRVWSPDGSSILLPVVAEDGTESLQVLPVDGSQVRILAPGSMGFWSP
jgi:TolB protein